MLTSTDGSGSTSYIGGITVDAADPIAALAARTLGCWNKVYYSAALLPALSANVLSSLLPPTTTHSTLLSPHAHAAHG